MRRVLHWVLFPITLPLAIAFWYWMFCTGGFHDQYEWMKDKNKKK